MASVTLPGPSHDTSSANRLAKKQSIIQKISDGLKKNESYIVIGHISESVFHELRDYFWNFQSVYLSEYISYKDTVVAKSTANKEERNKEVHVDKEVVPVFQRILFVAKKELVKLGKDGCTPIQIELDMLLGYKHAYVIREINEALEGGRIIMKDGQWHISNSPPEKAAESPKTNKPIEESSDKRVIPKKPLISAKERGQKSIHEALEKRESDEFNPYIDIGHVNRSVFLELKDYFWNFQSVYLSEYYDYNNQVSAIVPLDKGKRKKICSGIDVVPVFNKILLLAQQELQRMQDGESLSFKFPTNELLGYQYPFVIKEINENLKDGKIILKNGEWFVSKQKHEETKED